jgi:hypothetical protein
MSGNIHIAAPLGALLAVALTAAIPAPALAAGHTGKSAQSASVTDFSARRQIHHYRHHRYSYAPWPFDWHRGHVSNPGYGPGTRQLRQAQRRGSCVIDEGYGRSFACGND